MEKPELSDYNNGEGNCKVLVTYGRCVFNQGRHRPPMVTTEQETLEVPSRQIDMEDYVTKIFAWITWTKRDDWETESRFDVRIDAVLQPDGRWDYAESHDADCTCVLCTYGAIRYSTR